MKSWLPRFLLLLPVLALVGWFAIEQLPAWTAPSLPWLRYPDLVALPGGCEAANVLRIYSAERQSDWVASDASDARAREVSEGLLQAQYPGQAYTFVLAPEPVRGRFAEGSTPWLSLVTFAPQDDLLAQGAVILADLNNGEAIDVIHVTGISSMAAPCGEFAPQPQGMRAKLRPFLPLILAAGYVVVGGVGWVAVRIWNRRQNSTVRQGESG